LADLNHSDLNQAIFGQKSYDLNHKIWLVWIILYALKSITNTYAVAFYIFM